MVAGLSGLVTCLQSNLIGPNLHGLFTNLGGLFSFPLIGSLFLARRMLIGWLQVIWWGWGIPTISGETETQVRAACQPRQPHRWNSTVRRLTNKKWQALCCFQKTPKLDQSNCYNEEKNEPVCFFWHFWGCRYPAFTVRKYFFFHKSPITRLTKRFSL